MRVLFEHLNYLKNESDLGCILIGAAFLENCLEDLLYASMTFAEGPFKSGISRVIQSFYGKICVAYAFGLIGPDEAVELDRFKKIRNIAAHTSSPSQFADPRILEVVKSMHAARIHGWDPENPKFKYVVSLTVQVGRLQKKRKLVAPMGYFPMDGLEGSSLEDNPMEATNSKVQDGKLIPGRMWWDFSKNAYDQAGGPMVPSSDPLGTNADEP